MNEDIKLIAEFMGYDGQHEEWCGNNILVEDQFSDQGYTMIGYNPDKDWGQLMPVVEKISKIRCQPDDPIDTDTHHMRTFGMISDENGMVLVRINRTSLFDAPTLIEATYLAVVDFIKNRT